jgi:hypothetical protein
MQVVFVSILVAFLKHPVHVMAQSSPKYTSLVASISIFSMATFGVCVMASAISSHYVDKQVVEKMEARIPAERNALRVFNHLQDGTFADVLMLRDMAKSGLPLTNVLLMTAYAQAGAPRDQDAHLMQALTSMQDPDLLLLLSFAQERFVSKPQDSTLDDSQVAQLNTCFDTLKTRYEGRLGEVRSRYAYLNNLKSCQKA